MSTDPRADALDPDIEVICSECHRPLREIASRALGTGPVCRRGLRDIAHPGAGQLSLDLELTPTDMLPED